MTITTNPSRDEYTSGPGQTVFNYTFKIYANNELDVYVTPAGQQANDATDLTTDYVVDPVTIGDENGGFITFNTPLNNGDLVTIVSGIDYDRTVDYQVNGDFIPSTVNTDNDRQVSQIKQVLELARKAVVFGQAQQGTSGLTSEAPEAGKFIRWKSDLSGFENTDLTDVGSLVPIASIDVVYPTVALMKADSLNVLAPGVTVSTQGYYVAGDGGGSRYVVDAPQSVDEFGSHTLASGNVALIQVGDSVNAASFGVIDTRPDVTPALAAITNYIEGGGIKKLSILSGNYSLSEFWGAPWTGLYDPLEIDAYGAVFNNTVVLGEGVSCKGLEVDGSPDVGFVYTRGHGCHHQSLIAKNCTSHGHYFGVSSRQTLTLSGVAGTFVVGETVTGGTSGTTGKIESINGSVLEVINCDSLFQASETISGAAANGTLDSLDTPYGINYQVVRGSFTALHADLCGGDGFHWDGTAVANRSWMNSTAFESCSSTNNSGDGFRSRAYTLAPGGNARLNYNTFTNCGAEGNAGQSFIDDIGVQNTFIGGHYVDGDGVNCVELRDPGNNFIFGGRYVENILISDDSFVYANTASSGEGAIIAKIPNVDKFIAIGYSFVKGGFNNVPSSLISSVVAGDNLTGHTITIDSSGLAIATNNAIFKLNGFGQRNDTGGFNQLFTFGLRIHVNWDTGVVGYADYAEEAIEGASITSVAIDGSNNITITFNTTHQIFNIYSTSEYYDLEETNIN